MVQTREFLVLFSPNEGAYLLLQLFASMEISGYRVELVTEKGVWKSATIKHGAQFVTTSGTPLMLEWLASNLDSLELVKLIFTPHPSLQ
jgi:hypothetical protein